MKVRLEELISNFGIISRLEADCFHLIGLLIKIRERITNKQPYKVEVEYALSLRDSMIITALNLKQLEKIWPNLKFDNGRGKAQNGNRKKNI
jgi:hypothetical protein